MMHRAFLVSTLAAVAAVVGPRAGSAQDSAQFDTGSVLVTSGSGQVSRPPSRAVIRFSVDSRGPTAAAASAANGTRVRQLLDALNAVRQPEESVQVVGVSVRPNQNYQTGVVRHYESSAVVRMAIRALARLSRVLDVGLASGATGLSDVEFGADSTEEAQRAALAQAFADARANAEAIARAAGARLGPLLRVTNVPDEEPRSFGGAALALERVDVTGGATIAPREIVLTATLYATWRLRPAH